MKALVAQMTARSLQAIATNVSRWDKVQELKPLLKSTADIAAAQAEMHALAKVLLEKPVTEVKA